MEIEELRNIGRKIMAELSTSRRALEGGTALGVGAAGDKSFLIDRKVEEIILSELENLGLPFTITSEEAGTLDLRGGGENIVVDPVDGSKNAVSGIPMYCASIASAEGNTMADLRTSYILNLVTGDEYWAERGAGAFFNGKRIQAQQDGELKVLLYEAQAPGKDIRRILPLIAGSRKVRCFGSTALDLAYLSFGSASLFVCPSPSRSFDYAGGMLLLQESGGILTDLEGGDMGRIVFGLKRSVSLLAAANREIHAKALHLLAEITERV